MKENKDIEVFYENEEREDLTQIHREGCPTQDGLVHFSRMICEWCYQDNEEEEKEKLAQIGFEIQKALDLLGCLITDKCLIWSNEEKKAYEISIILSEKLIKNTWR